ncbi:hypothetical protein [Flavobacterium sp.]|jgi:hypothetical protein|uniref:hypothetical protein n=1 Tax=Flavobacterium sp. TaxID=239 RepID=UPI0037BF8C96
MTHELNTTALIARCRSLAEECESVSTRLTLPGRRSQMSVESFKSYINLNWLAGSLQKSDTPDEWLEITYAYLQTIKHNLPGWKAAAAYIERESK